MNGIYMNKRPDSKMKIRRMNCRLNRVIHQPVPLAQFLHDEQNTQKPHEINCNTPFPDDNSEEKSNENITNEQLFDILDSILESIEILRTSVKNLNREINILKDGINNITDSNEKILNMFNVSAINE